MSDANQNRERRDPVSKPCGSCAGSGVTLVLLYGERKPCPDCDGGSLPAKEAT